LRNTLVLTRRIREFNLALLGKCVGGCWWIEMGFGSSPWLLDTALRGAVDGGGWEGSVWWKDIVAIRDGSWFLDNHRLQVGNGADIMFWLDRWVGDVPLSVCFSRLYELCDDKLCTVAQRFARGWDAEGEAGKWRRQLWVWEEDLLV